MRVFILLAISILFLSCSNNATKNDICVTKVVLNWKDMSLKDRNNILNQAFNIEVNKKLAYDMTHNKNKNVILGEMGSLKNNEWIYFIYKPNQCKDRVKYTKLVMKKYFNNIQGAPAYIIIGSISKKEFDILTHQNLYNEKEEEKKWLNKETERQIKSLK